MTETRLARLVLLGAVALTVLAAPLAGTVAAVGGPAGLGVQDDVDGNESDSMDGNESMDDDSMEGNESMDDGSMDDGDDSMDDGDSMGGDDSMEGDSTDESSDDQGGLPVGVQTIGLVLAVAGLLGGVGYYYTQ